MKLLELNKVNVYSKNNHRLKNINLTIGSGEKVALLGNSGSGKSTLISIINGSLLPSSGKVFFKDLEIKNLSPRSLTKIATIWQDLRLIEDLNVLQNINVGALGHHSLYWSILNLIGLTDNKKSLNCLNAVKLPINLYKKQVRSLSGGQKQRIAIARMLRQQGDLLLADEPISNLDPYLANAMIKLLLGLEYPQSIEVPDTILMSIHRPELISNFTRVIGLKAGEIIIDLTSNKLREQDIRLLYSNP